MNINNFNIDNLTLEEVTVEDEGYVIIKVDDHTNITGKMFVQEDFKYGMPAHNKVNFIPIAKTNLIVTAKGAHPELITDKKVKSTIIKTLRKMVKLYIVNHVKGVDECLYLCEMSMCGGEYIGHRG